MTWTPERIARVKIWLGDMEPVQCPAEADELTLARIGLAVVEASPETVERVAREIQQVAEQDGAAPFDALPLIHKHAQEELRRAARAVLAALSGE